MSFAVFKCSRAVCLASDMVTIPNTAPADVLENEVNSHPVLELIVCVPGTVVSLDFGNHEPMYDKNLQFGGIYLSQRLHANIDCECCIECANLWALPFTKSFRRCRIRGLD